MLAVFYLANFHARIRLIGIAYGRMSLCSRIPAVLVMILVLALQAAGQERLRLLEVRLQMSG